jgi:hypothetical protein
MKTAKCISAAMRLSAKPRRIKVRGLPVRQCAISAWQRGAAFVTFA